VSDWYEVGMVVGLGLAAGVFFAGVVGAWRVGWLLSLVGSVGVGVLAGLLVRAWLDTGGAPLPGGIIGGVIGSVSASLIVRGALRRGGTAGGTAFLLVSASVAIALLALIPVVGYVMAVALPVLALRRTRREPERYAGLRTLSK
jgi:hypothetical protein